MQSWNHYIYVEFDLKQVFFGIHISSEEPFHGLEKSYFYQEITFCTCNLYLILASHFENMIWSIK